MKLYVATHNQHKVREISQILPDFEVVPDDPEGVEENAPDFAGNALVKVRAIAAKHKGEWCMADDSGLEVRALGGAPGVRSARYAGEPSNTPANNALLLKNLEGVEDRAANFTCSVALVDPEGREHVVVGKCFGRIALAPSGAEGFGYDPLFLPDGHEKSFAELTADEKNAISHRGRALEKAKKILGKRNSFLAWLRFFRVVNLPTVPGDVFVGAAASLAGVSLSHSGECMTALWQSSAIASVWKMANASVFLYMFGLAQNDIMGAKTDKGRPIPDGEISLGAAKAACWACWLYAGLLVLIPFIGRLATFFPAFVLLLIMTVIVSAYNATKKPLLMGLCRALNLGWGGVAVALKSQEGVNAKSMLFLAGLAAVWFAYIWAVTKYSEGEEEDPAKKRRVGALVGGIVYLQLSALIVLALAFPKVAAVRTLLVAGAVLLVVMRIMKRLLPRVSAS